VLKISNLTAICEPSSRSYVSLNVLEPDEPPRPVTGIDLFFLHVDDVRTSQETHLRASTACYEDNFTSVYVRYVSISQETRLGPSTACYGDSFTFCMLMMFVPHRKHA
jgi:hypothetical protein